MSRSYPKNKEIALKTSHWTGEKQNRIGYTRGVDTLSRLDCQLCRYGDRIGNVRSETSVKYDIIELIIEV